MVWLGYGELFDNVHAGNISLVAGMYPLEYKHVWTKPDTTAEIHTSKIPSEHGTFILEIHLHIPVGVIAYASINGDAWTLASRVTRLPLECLDQSIVIKLKIVGGRCPQEDGFTDPRTLGVCINQLTYYFDDNNLISAETLQKIRTGRGASDFDAMLQICVGLLGRLFQVFSWYTLPEYWRDIDAQLQDAVESYIFLQRTSPTSL